MSDFAESLRTAEARGGHGGRGTNVLTTLIAILPEEEAKELESALSDFDVPRNQFRVSSHQISEILEQNGHPVAQSTVALWRSRHHCKDQAVAVYVAAHEAKEAEAQAQSTE